MKIKRNSIITKPTVINSLKDYKKAIKAFHYRHNFIIFSSSSVGPIVFARCKPHSNLVNNINIMFLNKSVKPPTIFRRCFPLDCKEFISDELSVLISTGTDIDVDCLAHKVLLSTTYAVIDINPIMLICYIHTLNAVCKQAK